MNCDHICLLFLLQVKSKNVQFSLPLLSPMFWPKCWLLGGPHAILVSCEYLKLSTRTGGETSTTVLASKVSIVGLMSEWALSMPVSSIVRCVRWTTEKCNPNTSCQTKSSEYFISWQFKTPETIKFMITFSQTAWSANRLIDCSAHLYPECNLQGQGGFAAFLCLHVKANIANIDIRGETRGLIDLRVDQSVAELCLL